VPRHRLGLHRHRVGLLPVNTSAECAIQLRGQKKTGRNLRRGPVKTLSIESAGIEACLPGKYPGKSISANQFGESNQMTQFQSAGPMNLSYCHSRENRAGLRNPATCRATAIARYGYTLPSLT
jgi:hypothetical protein